jgi:hypothetical protein
MNKKSTPRYWWQEGTLHCIVLYCIHSIVWQDGRAALVKIEVTNYSQHEFSIVSTGSRSILSEEMKDGTT